MAFDAAHADLKTYRGDTDEDDAAVASALDRWYAALDVAVAIPARTVAGQQAKLRAAHTALWDALKDEPTFGNREEYAALAVLRELLGDAVASCDRVEASRASTLPRALSVLEIGWHLREADARFCASDACVTEAPDETPEQRATRVQHDGWDLNELLGWRRLALCRMPVTLTDAAAQLAMLYDHVADVDTSMVEGRPDADDLVADIKTTIRVVAGLAVTVARVAGLDVRTVVDDDLPHRLGNHVPTTA